MPESPRRSRLVLALATTTDPMAPNMTGTKAITKLERSHLAMKRKVLIASLLTLALVAVGGSAVAWASSARQAAPPLTGNLAAMHGACVSGNAEAMRAAIDNMTPEAWQAMAGQMSAHMSGGAGSMMGGAGGMMGSGSAGGMMGGASMMGPGAGMTF